MNDTALNRAGGRKFIIALIIIACATGLLCFKLIDQSTWSTVIIMVGSGYFASNVTQKAVTKNTAAPS